MNKVTIFLLAGGGGGGFSTIKNRPAGNPAQAVQGV